ncbi:GNAT family N-acetyltransferase [Rufibacter sp. XAAS-G3-1]|uniref:GNAT family N-acetyltransferase n=1 Tax=Rufibacter sp. XAAS-G3-1 TaxID=2729134 RepID=UPI0015E7B09A
MTLEGHTAFIDYKLRLGVMTVLHTQVPKEREGRGIAGALSKRALEYMAAYLKKPPEYQYLVKH